MNSKSSNMPSVSAEADQRKPVGDNVIHELWHDSLFVRYAGSAGEKEWLAFHVLMHTPAGETMSFAYVPVSTLRRLIETPPKPGEDLGFIIRRNGFDGPEDMHVVPAPFTDRFLATMLEALVILKQHQPLEAHGYLCLTRKNRSAPLELDYTEHTVPRHRFSKVANDPLENRLPPDHRETD